MKKYQRQYLDVGLLHEINEQLNAGVMGKFARAYERSTITPEFLCEVESIWGVVISCDLSEKGTVAFVIDSDMVPTGVECLQRRGALDIVAASNLRHALNSIASEIGFTIESVALLWPMPCRPGHYVSASRPLSPTDNNYHVVITETPVRF